MGRGVYAYANGNPLTFIDPLGLARTTVDAAIEQAIRRGDIAELETLLNAVEANSAQEAAIQAGLQRLRSTAQQIISKECKGIVQREFPRQFLDTTLDEIIDISKTGDQSARKALKLLTDPRFPK